MGEQELKDLLNQVVEGTSLFMDAYDKKEIASDYQYIEVTKCPTSKMFVLYINGQQKSGYSIITPLLRSLTDPKVMDTLKFYDIKIINSSNIGKQSL